MPIATEAPCGHMKGPDNKDFWIIDEETAEVVRLIFRLFIGGKRHVAYCSEYHKGKAKNPKCHSPHIIDADLLIPTIAEVLKKIEDYSISNRAEFEALVKKILAIESSPMDHFHGAVVRFCWIYVREPEATIDPAAVFINYPLCHTCAGAFVGIIYFHYKQSRKLVTGVPETMRGIGGVYCRVSLSKMAQLLWSVGKRMYCQLKAPLQHQHILQAAVMVIFEPCAGLEIKVKPAEVIGIPSLRQAENLHAGLGKSFRGGREVYDPAL